MKTKTVKVIETKHYSVNCERNDIVDIKAGGPTVLGFDFYVDADIPEHIITNFIETKLQEFDRPLMSINVLGTKDVEFGKQWTFVKMEEAIRKGY